MRPRRVATLYALLLWAVATGWGTAEGLPADRHEAQASERQTTAEQDEDAAEEPISQIFHEIVVTARRIEESAQDVPLSVSVYAEEELEALQIFGPEDLRHLIPSLQFYEFNVGLPHYFIRGIGSVNRSAASDPAVGLFVDDVYMGRGYGAAADFFDLERVEVLRGPQGTLFGRNSVGGAVVLHTRQPTAELEGSVSMRGGSRDRMDVGAVLNVPLGNRAFTRIALLGKSYEGNAFNTLTGNHLENEHRRMVRAALKLLPAPRVEVHLSGDRTDDDARGNWWHLGAEGPLSIGNANPDPRRGANPLDGQERRNDRGAALRAMWTASTGVLTSVTSYRKHHYQALDNTTGLFVAELDDPDRFRFHHTLFIQGQRQTSRTVSQELRWSSTFNEDLAVIGGIYYFREDVERLPTTRYRFVFFDSEGEFGHDSRNLLTSYAAFGQAEYALTNAVRVAVGLRFTEDRKQHRSSTLGQHFLGFRDRGTPVEGWFVREDGRWSESTPLVSVRYLATPDTTLYGTVAKGFKSGGFNDEGAERALVATAFGPEIAWNYEMGLKSNLWNGLCRWNVSAFHLDYRDLQVEQFIRPDPSLPPVEIITNAGSSTVRGVELDWDARFPRGPWIYGSYSYMDTKIDDLVLDGLDLSGNRLAYAPKTLASVGLGYRLETARRGSLSMRAGFSYTSRSFGDIGNSAVIELEPRKLVDAGGEWVPATGPWSFGFWGKNLTDHRYAVTATEVPVQDRYEKLGPPRQFGLSAAYRFGGQRRRH